MTISHAPVPRGSLVTDAIRRREPDINTQLLIVALELRLLTRALSMETPRLLLDRRVGMARMEELAATLEHLANVRSSSASKRQSNLFDQNVE